MKVFGYAMACALLFLSACAGHKEIQALPGLGSHFHTPVQILKIMNDSKILYTLDTLDSVIPDSAIKTPDMNNQLYLKNNNGMVQLAEYQLDDKARKIFQEAEKNFSAGQFNIALKKYKELYRVAPFYAYANTLAGDVFFNQQNYDSAAYYYKKAIVQNPVDYSAHWFLADTYWKQGKGLEAVQEITKAHLLNPGHKNLTKALYYYRNQVGQPWKEWYFTPQYKLSAKDHKVFIHTRAGFIGYAMVKALWRYEPGYAQAMTGEKYSENSINLMEESEAVNMLISGKEGWERIKKIVTDGFFEEFFYYEIVARRVPQALLLFPPNKIDRLVDYLSRFH